MISEKNSCQQFATPSKFNGTKGNRISYIQSTVDISFDDQKDFLTPIKSSMMQRDQFENAPKKCPNSLFTLTNCDQICKKLFDDTDKIQIEETSIEIEFLKNIRGLLFLYRINHSHFFKESFLLWLVQSEELKKIMNYLIQTLLLGFNERSKTFFKFLHKGTFLEIIGEDLHSFNTTLHILESKISQFSMDITRTQIDVMEDNLFYSIQGKYIDLNENLGNFILTMKIILVESVLDYPNAELQDLLRVDYIKVLN